MLNYKTIALDAMGGDNGLKVVVPAALAILEKYPNIRLILVGDQDQIERRFRGNKAVKFLKTDRLVVKHATEYVGMDESPGLALRNKKDSSMRVAINLVKQSDAQACVSAGNTGALMATARFVLKMLPGVDRPAMVSALPTIMGKPAYMLDLGANVESTARHLVEYAIMGSIVAQASMANGERPRVALLNIGSEDIKGTSVIKEASQMLNELKVVNYIGYIEANDVFQAKADVVVCDGFVGNVALKTCEGTARFILRGIKQGFKKNLFTKFCALFMLPVIGPIKKRIDPARYNGASLLGLNGIVIKSHGNTSVIGYMRAIEEAIIEIEKNVPEQISHRVEEVLQNNGNEE